ncbi:hypothetical protein PPTG_10555 [Phytophthora nicotianae INRA-310]|uniref:Uncharacterized protein n=1 Tax=Phytophthora nicotianae (strain INRA-310) TaxID=761204 RepID=W2QC33_PHYN3|nr:hypothetical protein PPTG_10555 [Phytophthora nicotianae INRA-310]ETN10416.1 hypothetical protein PPTG_10555 [Phytophthora nicotianae INRA-310]
MTNQSFRVRTNNNVGERNNKIAKMKTRDPLIPNEWIVYNKTLVCTYAGKYKPRGKGKRPRQEVRTTQCGAQVCIRHELNNVGGLRWAQVGSFEL